MTPSGPEFTIGESLLIDETLDSREALRTFLRAAEERGHPAPTVVIDEHGRPLTHPDYADRMGVFHARADAWAFCRRPRSEALGLVPGTDWIRDHAIHLAFEGGSPFLAAPHLYNQVALQEGADGAVVALPPVCAAGPVAWNNAGTKIAFMDERLGDLKHSPVMATHVLWEYDVVLGKTRRVAVFPKSIGLGDFDLSHSPADDWLLICNWSSGLNILVRIADGFVVQLPVRSPAVSWNPARGPQALLVMLPSEDPAGLRILDYDVATAEWTIRQIIASPSGQPMHVRELEVHPDGQLALAVAPGGVSALQQARRGGVMVASVIQLDAGSIEHLFTVPLRTPGAERRHTSPHWSHRPQPSPGATQVAESLVRSGSFLSVAPDDQSVATDYTRRWAEAARGIDEAWASGRLAPARLVAEFAQFVHAIEMVDEDLAEQVTSAVRTRARLDPAARSAGRLIEATRRSGQAKTPTRPADIPAQPQPAVDELTAARVNDALGQLIAAPNRDAVPDAARAVAAQAGPGPAGWQVIARMARAAAAAEEHLTAARIALACHLWHQIYLPDEPRLVTSGLTECPPEEQVAILLSGLVAGRHLDLADVVATDGLDVFDVGSVENRIQHDLQDLDVEGYLYRHGSPDRWASHVLARARARRATDAAREAAIKPLVFISYVTEDKALVEKLVATLQAEGYSTFLDSKDLEGGARWRLKIHEAIRAGSYFVACFSSALAAREASYMYDEIRLAIDQMRLMSPNRNWFIPIKFDECDLPPFYLGGGEYLHEVFHFVRFYPSWDDGMERLRRALKPETGKESPTD